MERQPHDPKGGERQQHDDPVAADAQGNVAGDQAPNAETERPDAPGVNTYGTDDPAIQARIEQARASAAAGRRRNRVKLEHLVELGLAPDDAETLIEFGNDLRTQAAQRRNEAAHTEPSEPRPRWQPRVYVADLASQARGIQHGLWIDADQDADELRADIAAMLDASPTPGASEWAFQATEDFGGLALHGYHDLALVAELGRGVAEYGPAYAVWVELVGTDDRDLLARFTDFYVGSYDSPAAWAETVGDDLEWSAHLDQVVDPQLRPYVRIDYEQFASDARVSWDVLTGIDGKTYVFLR